MPDLLTPRYNDIMACYRCGGPCASGYIEAHDSDSEGGYVETLYYCTQCAKEMNR